jgi:hypothetical protein
MNLFIFVFVDGVSIRKKNKKWRGTASLRVAHDAKFSSFFFFSDGYSIHKQTKK